MTNSPFTRDAIKGALKTVDAMKQRAMARGVNGLPAYQAMKREERRLGQLYYQLCLKDYVNGTLGMDDDWSWEA